MKAYFIIIPLLVASMAIAQIEEITFTSDDLTLAGNLYIPNGEGPFPAAILVHGSGPINRYQTIELVDGNSQCIYPELANKTIENFKDIAEHLHQNGMAVLIYDKRSFTHGEDLNPITASTKDFIRDIENAIDFLSKKTKVNSESIFLIGHSQGSALIPIAAQNKNIAGLISLSGAVTPPDSLVAEQFRSLYIKCTDDANTGMIVANRFYREFEKIRNNELADTTQIEIRIPGGDPGEPIKYGFPIFWRDWIEQAEQVIANYKANNLPMLFIHGDDDFNVPLNDVYRFEKGLPADLTTVEVFEGVNHLLTTATSPKVSSSVLTSISSWIKSNTMPVAIETNLVEAVEIFHSQGNIQIQHIDQSNNFNAVLVASMDGRILYQAAIKHSEQISFPIPINSQLVNVSLFSEQGVYSQLISIH